MRNVTTDAIQTATEEMGALLQTCYGFLVPLLFSGLAAIWRYHNPTRHRLLLSAATFVGKRWWSSQERREPANSQSSMRETPGERAKFDDASLYHPSASVLSKICERLVIETSRSLGLLHDGQSENGVWSPIKFSLVPLLEVVGKVKYSWRDNPTTHTEDTLESRLESSQSPPPIDPQSSPGKIPVYYKQLVLRDSDTGLLQHKLQEKNPVKEVAEVLLTATEIVEDLRPVRPLVLSRPQEAVLAAREFVAATNIQTMYAVKANDDPLLLNTLWDTGIQWFEVASIFEVKHVMQSLPSPKSPTFCFMNPVKPEEDIRDAYFECNVRVFALHSEKELDKIIRATTSDGREAQDLDLFVRLKVNSQHAELDLNPKFGVEGVPAIELLQRLKREGRNFGVCFHIGSQITDVGDFGTAMHEVNELEKQAGVQASKWSIGGGFGVPYPDREAPTISECLETVEITWRKLFGNREMKVCCEPGRALAAKSESLVARVEERRGMELYVNTGAYDMMSDAARLKWRYAVKLLRQTPSHAEIREFSLWGPTGDSLDYLPGPFLIPEDVKEGDYIEIINTGAYGRVLISRFNGLGEYAQVIVGGLASKGDEQCR